MPTGSQRKAVSDRLVFSDLSGDECFLVIVGFKVILLKQMVISEILLFILFIYKLSSYTKNNAAGFIELFIKP